MSSVRRVVLAALAAVGTSFGVARATPAEVASEVADLIYDSMAPFNEYLAQHAGISQGEKATLTPIAGASAAATTYTISPFAPTDLFAIAGTASNLLACREAVGNDLDFWSRRQLYNTNGPINRVEFAAAHGDEKAKDHWWPSKSATGGTVDAGDSKLLKHINGGEGPFYTGPREMDIWAESANIVDKDTEVIRKNVNNGVFSEFDVKSKKTPSRNLRVQTHHIADLIRQKVGLVLRFSRQSKKHGTTNLVMAAAPKGAIQPAPEMNRVEVPNYADGKKKLYQDAGDLACLCAHPQAAHAKTGSFDMNGFRCNTLDVKRVCFEYTGPPAAPVFADPPVLRNWQAVADHFKNQALADYTADVMHADTTGAGTLTAVSDLPPVVRKALTGVDDVLQTIPAACEKIPASF